MEQEEATLLLAPRDAISHGFQNFSRLHHRLGLQIASNLSLSIPPCCTSPLNKTVSVPISEPVSVTVSEPIGKMAKSDAEVNQGDIKESEEVGKDKEVDGERQGKREEVSLASSNMTMRKIYPFL